MSASSPHVPDYIPKQLPVAEDKGSSSNPLSFPIGSPAARAVSGEACTLLLLFHCPSCLHSLDSAGGWNEGEQVEWNGDTDNTSWFRVLLLSRSEWPILVAGVLAAGIQGAIFPSFSIFFGQAIEAFTYPFNQVSSYAHNCWWLGLTAVLPCRYWASHTSGRGYF